MDHLCWQNLSSVVEVQSVGLYSDYRDLLDFTFGFESGS